MSENTDDDPGQVHTHLTMEMVITKMHKIINRRRRLKAEWELEDTKLKNLLDACEAFVLQELNDSGLTSVAVRGVGTAYRTTKLMAGCSDWDTLHRWVSETGNYQLYMKGLVASEVKAYMENNGGMPPPAVNAHTEAVVKFKKATGT